MGQFGPHLFWEQGTPSRGHALSLGEGAPPPPKDHTCQGHPRDKQEEVESAPGPSIDLVRAGGFSQSVPLAEEGYCRDCDTCDERGNAGKRQHVIEEIGLHGILPNRGTPRIPQEATGILVPGYRAAGDFFSVAPWGTDSAQRSKCEKLRILRACRWRPIGLRRDALNQRVHNALRRWWR